MNVQQKTETGHIPMEQGMPGKVEPKTGKTEAVEESKEIKLNQLCGITFSEKDLELKDFTCTLKMNEKCMSPTCLHFPFVAFLAFSVLTRLFFAVLHAGSDICSALHHRQHVRRIRQHYDAQRRS